MSDPSAVLSAAAGALDSAAAAGRQLSEAAAKLPESGEARSAAEG